MGTLNSSGGSLWAEQDKDENLDYALDWSDLLVDGDTIQTSTFTATGVTITNQAFNAPFTSFWVTGGEPETWYPVKNSVETVNGRKGQKTLMLFIKKDEEEISQMGSALFPNRFTAVANLRKDNLTLLASSIMPDLELSEDFLWKKLLAAESEIAHSLRVPLAPTRYFPHQPTQEQIDALNGQPWAIDQPYDYDPNNFNGDKWGLIILRQKPVQSIVSMKFVYPSPAQAIVDVPADWIRLDRRYGHLQLVPTSTISMVMGGFWLTMVSGGRQLPFSIDIDYVAGIANAAKEYPELVEAVTKLAVIKIVEDGFMPQSGSISADGLSESVSVDVSKYRESIDYILNGPTGSNGGLMSQIHGVRVGFM